MSDAEPHGPEGRRTGIPRDLPDQEAAGGAEPGGAEEEPTDTGGAGTGPRRSASPLAEDRADPPEPDEPTD